MGIESEPPSLLPLHQRSVPEIAAVLRETVGERLTALALEVGDHRVIGRFADGSDQASPHVETRLRTLAEVVEILLEQDGAAPVPDIMADPHPVLGDRSPTALFHDGQGQQVVANATHLLD